ARPRLRRDTGSAAPSPARGGLWNRPEDLSAGQARNERFRAGGWSGLSHVLHLCARIGWPLGYAPVARPRPQGPQRGAGTLVGPPRRIRHTLSQGHGYHVDAGRRDDIAGIVADARRRGDVDGMDADVRTGLGRCCCVLSRDVDRDDGGNDAAIVDPDAVVVPPIRRPGGQVTRLSAGCPRRGRLLPRLGTARRWG